MKGQRIAALVVLSGAAVVLSSPFSPIGDSRKDLVVQLGAVRPVPGRLGGFAYAPGKTPCSVANLKPRENEVKRRLSRGRTPGVLHDFALLKLCADKPAAAVDLLREALSSDAKNARLRSDLAASYLALGERSPEDLVRSLSQAAQAVELDPNLPEAWFNQALALEQLHLTSLARASWDQFLRLEPRSDWAREARRHRSRLGHSGEIHWEQARSSLERAVVQGDPAPIGRAVACFPQQARVWAEEEGLAAWARAHADGSLPLAERYLSGLREVGNALLETEGDRMLADSVGAIVAAASAASGRLENLVAGHLAYREGLDQYGEGRIREAGSRFSASYERFRRGQSPFARWAEFQLAVCDFQHGHDLEARDRVVAIAEDSQTEPYPVLRGRSLWISGLSLSVRGRLAESLAAYSSALSLFESAQEAENTAAVQNLIAENLRSIGDTPGSWRHHAAALAGLEGVLKPVRTQAILEEAAISALAIAEPAAALAFQDEVLVAIDRAEGRSWQAAVAQAFWRRAQIEVQFGRRDRAAADLERGIRLTRQIPDEIVRDVVLGSLLVVSGTVATDPRDGLEALDEAYALHTRLEYIQPLPNLLLERARVHRLLGDHHLAEQDLEEATQQVERVRANFPDHARRADFLKKSAAIFDQLLSVAFERGDVERSFDAAERAKARSLLDLSSHPKNGAATRPLPLKEIRRRLPKNVTLVEYAVLEDRLLAWVVRRAGEPRLVDVPVGSAALRSLISRWLAEIGRAENKRDEEQASAALHRVLIEPLGMVGGLDSLVFVPDKFLHTIPFAALRNQQLGRYLIEEHAISVSPSASFYIASAADVRPPTLAKEPSILAVGDAAFDRSLFPTLRPLPGAAGEVKRIVVAFPGSLMLTGKAATWSAVRARVGSYDVFHYAGHALFKPEFPLDSDLLLALGSTGDKGVVSVSDLGGINLGHLQLAVLAGCGTARGAESTSEGVASLVYPFLAAGVPTVIASLWNVGDRAGEEILTRFYSYLKTTGNAAAALRSAQLEMIRSPEITLGAPRNWGAFGLFGRLDGDNLGDNQPR